MKVTKNSITVFLSLFLVLAASIINAQVPQLLNYQGKLVKADGKAEDGTFTMLFSIYSTETGGTALWSETQNNVTVTKGVFNVLLGSVTALPNMLFSVSGARYLGIKVGNEAEMTPRFRLTSVAYAIKSTHTDTAQIAITALSGGSDGGNTLDQAYDQGGSGAGRTITADAGAVNIAGTDGLTVNGKVTASSFSGNGASITGLNASNITSGTVANARLDSDLQDLADGSLTGSKVGSGINASNITSGTISDARLESNIDRTSFNASDYITALGGIHVGGTSNPGTDNLVVDGIVRIGTIASSINSSLAVNNGHIETQQTNRPTITLNTTYYSGSASISTNPPSTDVAGKFTFEVVTAGAAGAKIVTINFNKSYSVEPIVIITPASLWAAIKWIEFEMYVDATTTGFSIRSNKFPTNSRSMTFNYFVIGTD